MGMLVRLQGDEEKSPHPDFLELRSTFTSTVSFLQQTGSKRSQCVRDLGIGLHSAKQNIALLHL